MLPWQLLSRVSRTSLLSLALFATVPVIPSAPAHAILSDGTYDLVNNVDRLSGYFTIENGIATDWDFMQSGITMWTPQAGNFFSTPTGLGQFIYTPTYVLQLGITWDAPYFGQIVRSDLIDPQKTGYTFFGYLQFVPRERVPEPSSALLAGLGLLLVLSFGWQQRRQAG